MSGISDNPSIRLKELYEPVNIFLKESGVNFSVLVRTALRDFLRKQKNKNAGLDPKTPEELKKLRLDLAKVGSNLNQIAYYLNIDFPATPLEIKKSQAELQEIFKRIIELLKRLENEFKL
ncbi:MAG: plasmid mobilization relaxosome protein MobC [Deltaproteobacteria bacterium]|nr:plasmid mobilization relaxosome protein MobC [Deltaproteobacteria bacterium]